MWQIAIHGRWWQPKEKLSFARFRRGSQGLYEAESFFFSFTVKKLYNECFHSHCRVMAERIMLVGLKGILPPKILVGYFPWVFHLTAFTRCQMWRLYGDNQMIQIVYERKGVCLIHMQMSTEEFNNELLEYSKQVRWSHSSCFGGTKLEFLDNWKRKRLYREGKMRNTGDFCK